jgi:predicted phosphohydrolase
MKALLLSDLHLEFAPFSPPETDADVVILAGHIHQGVKAIPRINDAFPGIPVVYVPGNHEYYGQAIPKHTLKLKELTEGTHIHVLQEDSFLLGEIVILGCTLWIAFDLFGNPRIAGCFATENIYDFRKIRVSPTYRRLYSIDTAGLHYRYRCWLGEQFEQHRERKIVVVTHHALSPRSLRENSREELNSAASASRMEEFVEQSGARLWLHGHMHISTDYFIGRTHIISNPRGYTDEPNPKFLGDLVINI